MKKNEVKVKGRVNTKDLATRLEDLVKSLREGTVCIESGENFITLKPAENIAFEIEAARKKGKEKLVIEMKWRQAVPGEESEGAIKISSKEPEIEMPAPENAGDLTEKK